MLLLFDIDGTLVNTGGAGLGALQAGLVDAFALQGREDEIPPLDLAGTTDSTVARTLFSAMGIEDTVENRERFYAAYMARLRESFREPRGERLVGVLELLTKLREETDFVRSLLTGNVATGARIKLEHYEIAEFFEFRVGAFGDDRESRNELGPVALERAAEVCDREFSGHETVIIGDTPRDIACANAFGARSIAVATGSFGAEELETYRPDGLLNDLTDSSAFLALLESFA